LSWKTQSPGHGLSKVSDSSKEKIKNHIAGLANLETENIQY